jgi:hypothetical protein
MSSAQKQRFVDMANEDSKRYEAEVAAGGSEKEHKKRKTGGTPKDKNAPKRATSSFIFYSNVCFLHYLLLL